MKTQGKLEVQLPVVFSDRFICSVPFLGQPAAGSWVNTSQKCTIPCTSDLSSEDRENLVHIGKLELSAIR